MQIQLSKHLLMLDKIRIPVTTHVFSASLLIIAGLSKILGADGSYFLSTPLLRTTFPLYEVCLGSLAILLPKSRLISSCIATTYLIFLAWSIYRAIRGIHGDCGCGLPGFLSSDNAYIILGRNFILFIIALVSPLYSYYCTYQSKYILTS